ncbi:MAG: glycosyltransferase family 2 protein [Solirubrobacterales bacterium]
MSTEREQTAPPVAIVAARNEADRIGATLDALAATFPGARVFVADDASGDGTGEIALARGATVIGRRRPHGKGGNVTAAAEAALSDPGAAGRGNPVFLLCDADLGESVAVLRRLVEVVERGGADLAIASFARREGGGFGVARGYARRAIRDLSGYEPSAPISGQRAMRASVLRELLPFAAGWGMETGITIDAVRAGRRVVEVELPLAHRVTGRTLGGFIHRAAQLRDFRRAARARRRP